jgi:hypothetical protein
VFALPSPRKTAESFGRDGLVLVSEVLPPARRLRYSALAADSVRRAGASVRHGERADLLDYSVVDGEHVKRTAMPLFAMYQSSKLRDWLRIVTREPEIETSAQLRSAININCMGQTGQAYPWHTDATPYTALLFLTSMPPGGGGELCIHRIGGGLVKVTPVAGHLLVFDGTVCAHSVAPLLKDWRRLTLPMVFPKTNIERPKGLDHFLYHPTARSNAICGDSGSPGH